MKHKPHHEKPQKQKRTLNTPRTRRNHKDRLFCDLFSDKENALSLFNAVSGTDYTDLDALERDGVPVYKLFLFSGDLEMLNTIRLRLEENPEIAVASSFVSNLEITDVKAQKGPVLKQYIESLGYTMDEVMVFGDSLNDLSMLSMDFGATVAMENAVPEVKQAAKYITKSNEENGVAYAIRELLRYQKKEG